MFSRETELIYSMYIQRKRDVCFKDTAHTIVGADKSEICRVGQQTGDPEKR